MSIETFVKELATLNPKILEQNLLARSLSRRQLCALRLGRDLGLNNEDRWNLLSEIERWLTIEFDGETKRSFSAYDPSVRSLHFATARAVKEYQHQ